MRCQILLAGRLGITVAVEHDSRIVEGDVESAEGVLCELHHCAAVLHAGDVGRQEPGMSARFPHLALRLPARLLGYVHSNDLGAFAGEQQTRLAAYAAACAGDQCNLPVQSQRACPLCYVASTPSRHRR